jgi:glycosyltransferase involved in cell wall biosynthesis
MEQYPKIILLCDFSQSRANGITINNLFKGWPKDRIAVVEFSSPMESIYVPNITNYYILGAKEAHYIWPFSLLKKTGVSAAFKLDAAPPSQPKVAHRSSLFGKLKAFLSSLQVSILQRTGIAFVSRKFQVSPELETWVNDFSPDIIYTSTGDICKLEFIAEMKQRFDTELALHIFDDFINSKYESTLFPRYWERRLDGTFRRVLDLASLHLAIGDKMGDEYGAKYGKQFYGFHNPIDPDVWLKKDGVEVAQKQGASGFNFLYAGTINEDTAGPLKRFIEATDNLSKQGHEVRLGIHSPYPAEQIYHLLGESAKGVYLGKIPYEALPVAFRKADALLLPMDFSETTIRYMRLSMLTKATEYMISGTPIFVFAPQEIAVTEYLLEHHSAVHCGQPDELEASILSFMEDRSMRDEVSANAVSRAMEHHLMEPVGERLRSLLVATLGS